MAWTAGTSTSEGLSLGQIEDIVFALRKRSDGSVDCCMALGEYRRDLKTPGSPLASTCVPVKIALGQINPDERQVLWRLLSLQDYLYFAIAEDLPAGGLLSLQAHTLS
jgi:hypothetical protein